MSAPSGATRLFHFSDDPAIEIFTPRPVLVASKRPPGREWLNGPLVWAIDDWHQPMYLFPRDCPRILIWPTPQTSSEDYARYWSSSSTRMIAFIEGHWLDRLRSSALFRYELPSDRFESLEDAGMWVSKTAVRPLGGDWISDLPAALNAQNAELRVLDNLVGLRDVWRTSLHASGIRLRNAIGWET